MKRVVILGGGESGVGAALLAQKKGYDVFVSDYSPIADSFKEELVFANILFEEGNHTWGLISNADILIKSPGIPDGIKLIQDLLKEGIDPISEIEFASWFCDTKIIAITGSNGKTTTTALIYHLLSNCRVSAKIGGNYGISFARLLIEEEKPEYFVLELSSFQLDGIRKFKADISVLLNITADHLDRYKYNIDLYAQSKMRILNKQIKTDAFVYNAEDELIEKYLDKDQVDGYKIYSSKTKLEITSLETEYEYEFENQVLQSVHNRYNLQTAVYVAELCGLKPKAILEAIESFQGLEHRMDLIRIKENVRFINDSKATNVDAVEKALESVESPIIWIAGGTDKGNDYTSIQQFVKLKVKALICLGVNNEALKNAFQEVIPVIQETQDINQAVQEALRLAEGKGSVLLSPACASFDLFKNYIDRGNQFKDAVLAL